MYAFEHWCLAMNCFTCSGLFRLACLLMRVSMLSMCLIVFLLLPMFSRLISTFSMVFVKDGWFTVVSMGISGWFTILVGVLYKPAI